MTWTDSLRRITLPDGRKLIAASFRGVPFFVEEAERSGGRRITTHEFPLRDDPFVEDQGRRARRFRVEGYVVGDDVIEQKDALCAVLEDEGATGELVHPYEGVRSVICDTFSVRHRRAEGRIATFSIDFADAPTQEPSPTEEVDGAEQVSSSADAAVEAASAELEEQFDTTGLPSFALASAEVALKNATAELGARLAPVVTATQELAALTGQLSLITDTASTLVRTPAAALAAFRAAITGLVDTAGAAPGALMTALVEAYGADLGTLVDPITSTRARELANQKALIAALRRVLAIEAARLAPLATFASIDEALLARDQIAALLEEQAAAAEDAAYPDIVDLRSQVLAAVPGSSTFARVATVTRKTPVPSLLLAYQLYGSVDLEPDVVARNSIRHPGFVFGELKVLSDG